MKITTGANTFSTRKEAWRGTDSFFTVLRFCYLIFTPNKLANTRRKTPGFIKYERSVDFQPVMEHVSGFLSRSLTGSPY